MKIASLIFFLACSVLRAEQSPETTAYKIIQSNAEKVDSLNKLPVVVQVALKDKIGVTVDRGEAYSDDCTGSGPYHRFIQADHSADYWWIHYESGGYSHYSSVIIFEIKDRKACFISKCSAGIFSSDLEKLLESLKSISEQK